MLNKSDVSAPVDGPSVGTPSGMQSGTLLKAAKGMLSSSYLLIILLITAFVGTEVSPYFLTGRNLQNIVVTAAVVSVLAVGQFMVIVTAGIDLSVGSIAALATVVAAVLLRAGHSTGLAVLVTLVICGLVGVVNGGLVVYGGITPFIATLGMMSVVRGAAFLVQTGTLIGITNQRFLTTFSGTTGGIPHVVIIFVAVMLVTAFVMQFTPFGRRLYAIGGNPEASRLSGLPVNRDLLSAYGFAGLMAGLAGLMLAAQLSQGSSLVGQGYELDSIAAAVVGGASLFGGTGSPTTAVIGGLLIGTISNIMNLAGIQSEPQLIIKGALILVAVFLTSGGGPKRVKQLSVLMRRLVPRSTKEES
jgi:ribose transport system permease protein